MSNTVLSRFIYRQSKKCIKNKYTLNVFKIRKNKYLLFIIFIIFVCNEIKSEFNDKFIICYYFIIYDTYVKLSKAKAYATLIFKSSVELLQGFKFSTVLKEFDISLCYLFLRKITTYTDFVRCN